MEPPTAALPVAGSHVVHASGRSDREGGAPVHLRWRRAARGRAQMTQQRAITCIEGLGQEAGSGMEPPTAALDIAGSHIADRVSELESASCTQLARRRLSHMIYFPSRVHARCTSCGGVDMRAERSMTPWTRTSCVVRSTRRSVGP